MKNSLRDDRGAVAVLVALLLTALVLFAAISVDVGYLLDVRRQLQSAADAGALAGCWDLIRTGDSVSAENSARLWAIRNAVAPAGNLTVTGVQVDMTEGSVQVNVAQTTPSFFARIIRPSSNVIASAKARRWALAGGRYLVPWALPIIEEVDRVEVEIAGTGIRTDLSPSVSDPRVYEGTIYAPAGVGHYDLLARVYNGYDVVEKIVDSQGALNVETPVARISVVASATPVQTVTMSSDFVATDQQSPDWPLISITTAATEAGKVPSITINKQTYTMTGSGTSWSYQMNGSEVPFDPTAVDLLRTYPIDIKIAGGTAQTWAYFHVRRSTMVVDQIEVQPLAGSAGRAVQVSISLNDFEPATAVQGQIYTMRVGSQGNEAGNFGELNFSQMTHSADCPPDPDGLSKGNLYYDWTAYGYPGGVHIGDVIGLSPGGSGQNTLKALNTRFAGLPEEEWVVNVPVVQKYEQKSGGAFDVVVEKFAAFRILPGYDNKGNVRGEFIKYITNPSGFATNPGGGGGTSTLYAPRLVNPQ